MWSRIVETMLASWLAVSPFVFGFPDDELLLWVNAWAGAAAVMVLALGSLARRFDKLHLGILAVAGWLAGHTFLAAATTPPPPPYQNQLAVALLLAMLAVLPTRIQQPPDAWLRFHARHGRSADPDRLPGND